MTEPKRKPDFRKDLDFGKQAERDFCLAYYEPLILSADLRWDFTVIQSGERLELKTDDWDPAKTPNFFFEFKANLDKDTPGGPWRARKDRVSRFCYYFPRGNIYYEFKDVKSLCKRIEKYVKKNKEKPIWIKNVCWVTTGYKVPRAELQDLYTEHKI